MRSPDIGFDLRAALTSQVRCAADALGDADATAKAVHRCRVHLKHARALSRVGRTNAPGLAAVFNTSAREAMETLAVAREAAALAQAAEAAAHGAGKKQSAALHALAEALRASTANTPDLALARTALRDLQALAQVWPEASPRQIRKGAEHIELRARRARERGLKSTTPADRHQWRKREKDRLYAAMLLGKAWPEARRRKASAKLADVLGEERDARILAQRIAAGELSAGSVKADARAARALDKRVRKLMKDANRIGRAL